MFSTYQGAKRRASDLHKLLRDTPIHWPLHRCQLAIAKAAGYTDWHDLHTNMARGDLPPADRMTEEAFYSHLEATLSEMGLKMGLTPKPSSVPSLLPGGKGFRRFSSSDLKNMSNILREARRSPPRPWRWLRVGIDILTGRIISNDDLLHARKTSRQILLGHHNGLDEQWDIQLLMRFSKAILACDKPYVDAVTEIRFLPSADGPGCLSTIYGGCVPSKGWFADIGGPPLSRSFIISPPLDEDTLFENLVIDLLKKEGVTVLN